jgi:hypothetical protein
MVITSQIQEIAAQILIPTLPKSRWKCKSYRIILLAIIQVIIIADAARLVFATISLKLMRVRPRQRPSQKDKICNQLDYNREKRRIIKIQSAELSNRITSISKEIKSPKKKFSIMKKIIIKNATLKSKKKMSQEKIIRSSMLILEQENPRDYINKDKPDKTKLNLLPDKSNTITSKTIRQNQT